MKGISLGEISDIVTFDQWMYDSILENGSSSGLRIIVEEADEKEEYLVRPSLAAETKSITSIERPKMGSSFR